MTTETAGRIPEDAAERMLALPTWRRLPTYAFSDRTALRRRGGRRVLLLGFLLLLVALAGTDLALVRAVDHRHQASAAGRSAVAKARTLVPEVLSYNHGTLDEDLARGLAATSGSFKGQLSKLQTTVVAPAARDQQIVTRAVVTGAGVVSSTRNEAHLLVFVTQTTTARGREPQIDGSRITVTMTRVHSTWRISELAPI